MKKIILSLIVLAVTTTVFAQSTLITPGNQVNRASSPILTLTSAGGIPEIEGQKSQGTLAAPTNIASASSMLQLNGQGYFGGSFITGSRIRLASTESWSATARGSDIEFFTTKNGTTSISEKMRLTGDGYLGIGTTSPTTGFQLAGTSSDQTEINIHAPNSAIATLSFARSAGTLTTPTATPSGYNLGWINFNGYNGTSFTESSSIRSLSSAAWTSTSKGSYLSFHTTNAGTTTLLERLRIDDGGNVGIGTSAPNGKLHIEHDGTDTDPHVRIHSTGSFSRINWSTNTNANTWIAQSFLESATAASNYWRLEYGGSSRLHIAGDGNVGIGTSSPNNKLDVLGIIRANEVIVETGWADYVFQDNYKLKPLSEVEAFIKENKHLPSVPSAAKIQEKGAHVAELMTKMMEKIEELTLYSIEQKKEIDELKRRLDEKK